MSFTTHSSYWTGGDDSHRYRRHDYSSFSDRSVRSLWVGEVQSFYGDVERGWIGRARHRDCELGLAQESSANDQRDSLAAFFRASPHGAGASWDRSYYFSYYCPHRKRNYLPHGSSSPGPLPHGRTLGPDR